MRTIDTLSFSQLTTYAECGERWRLTKGYPHRGDSWYATEAGAAIHEITAELDLGQTPRGFRDVFDEYVEKALEVGSLKASGRKLRSSSLAGGPDKKDYAWWLDWGPRMIRAYVSWRDETPWTVVDVLTTEGLVPGVELDFEVTLGSSVVRGSIDRLFHDPDTGRTLVVDLKTGSEPGGKLQLATYRLAAEVAFGITSDYAAYISPFEEKSTGELRWGGMVHPLSGWSAEYVTHQYEMLRRGIDSGVFLANTRACHTCPVSELCRAKEGIGAWEYPIRENVWHNASGSSKNTEEGE